VADVGLAIRSILAPEQHDNHVLSSFQGIDGHSLPAYAGQINRADWLPDHVKFVLHGVEDCTEAGD
jgi:hypothetical protein